MMIADFVCFQAQCAELVKKGKAWAVGTEDMDALTFGAPVLLRYLTYSEARKQPVLEVTLSRVLEGLELDMKQFTDLCILMGCDYVETLPKIGKGRAYDLIKQYGSIEEVVKNVSGVMFCVSCQTYSFCSPDQQGEVSAA
jgi:flap endonuclease-1